MEEQLSPRHPTKKRTLFDLTLLCAFFFIFYLILIFILPIQTKFEGKTLLILQDTLQTHDWLTPTLNGAPILSSPPLYFWVTGLIAKCFGTGYLLIRGVSIFFSLLSLILMYITTQFVLTRMAAILSSIIFASNLLFVGTTLLATPTSFNIFLMTALLSTVVWLFFRQENSTKLLLLCWIVLSFFTLNVGIFFTIIFLLSILIWLLTLRSKKAIKQFFSIPGIILFLLITTPWFIASALHHPHFLSYYFVDAIYHNYLMFSANYFIPNWPTLLSVLLGFMPWTIFLASAFWYNLPFSWQDRQAEPLGLLLIFLSGFFILGFLCTNVNPLLVAILLPMFALVSGRYLAPGFQSATLPLKSNAYELLFILAIIGLSYGLTHVTLMYRSGVTHNLTFFLYLLGYIMIASVIALPILRYCSLKKGFITLFILSLVTYLLGVIIIKSQFQDKQTVLADYIVQHQTPDTIIASYHIYPPTIPLTLQKRIVMIDWKGMPHYAKTYAENNPWLVTEQAFWANLNTHAQPFFIIVPVNHIVSFLSEHSDIKIVAQSQNLFLVSNGNSRDEV